MLHPVLGLPVTTADRTIADLTDDAFAQLRDRGSLGVLLLRWPPSY